MVRGDEIEGQFRAEEQTRNLEIPDSQLTLRSGMTTEE
jgi:hypothetical protein